MKDAWAIIVSDREMELLAEATRLAIDARSWEPDEVALLSAMQDLLDEHIASRRQA